MIDADMRKASLCVRAVLEEKSNMKLWLILVLFHMKRLHPYRKMCRLMSANMLQKQVIVSLLVNDVKKKSPRPY
jgi:hypothetical protein